MEDHLSEEVAAVVTRVKDVLWDLPGPVHSPPEEFFAVANLSRLCTIKRHRLACRASCGTRGAGLLSIRARARTA